VAVDADLPVLPVDPAVAQPATLASAIVPGATPPPAPAASTPERKPESGRGGKTMQIALGQPDVPAISDADLPAAVPARESMAPSNDGSSFPDAALPADAAVRTETRPSTTPLSQQGFASQVTQAPAHSAAPAPVAAPADPMIPARAGQLGHALGVEIARKVEAGEDTLRVRLNPVELGRVEVTLAFDDKGNLRATMRAESQHALDLLRHDAPDLGRALDTAGVRADAQSFRFESRGDGTGAGGSGSQSGQQQSRGNGQQSFNDEPEVPAPVYRAIRTDGQVDLLA
jgi:flagellar hook-length control protein FliK